jgi:hypothetical protein
MNAANDASPLNFTQTQKEQLANNLRVLQHVPNIPDAASRAEQVKKLLTPEQMKAVDAAKAARKGEVTDADYKKAINGVLTAAGANR